MAFSASENKNHSILLALRSLSLELVNEDAEKYRPNSITTPADYLNVRPFQLAMCVRPDDSLAASTGYHVHYCDAYDLRKPKTKMWRRDMTY